MRRRLLISYSSARPGEAPSLKTRGPATLPVGSGLRYLPLLTGPILLRWSTADPGFPWPRGNDFRTIHRGGSGVPMRIPPALLRIELVCVIGCALARISYSSSVLVL